MARIIVASVVGGIIAFMWGFLSWSILPWHQPEPFTDEAEVAAFLKERTSGHNVYAYPAWDHSKEYDAPGKTAAGPYIYATVLPDGLKVSMGAMMAVGFLISVLAAATLAVLMLNSRQQTFLGRLSIALLAGMFLGIISAGNPWNWLGLPTSHAFGFLCDGIIPWTLVGAAMAKILPYQRD